MINQFDSDETIVALASSREPGYPRGIIRLSGPQTLEILDASFVPGDQSVLGHCKFPCRLTGDFKCDALSEPVPVFVLFWPNTRSYTGQISAEIHAPGSQPLLDAIIQQLCIGGARLANPGEFTLRAFLGGRIDLTEAEAVLGVIDAKDQKHLNVALKQLSGGLSRPIHQSRQNLLNTLAHLEAGLDFVEEDIEFVSNDELLSQISKCQNELKALRQQLENRDQVDTSLRLVLFGQPNVGKSSLFNELTNRYGQSSQTAIVSSVSGTTRDFVASRLNVHGREILLIDTAGVGDGLPDNPDPVDGEKDSPLKIGQDQSLLQQQESSLTLFCLDSSRPLTPWEIEELRKQDSRRIVCVTKSDLPASHDSLAVNVSAVQGDDRSVRVSSVSGAGIDELANLIGELMESGEPAETMASTAVRCTSVVDEALEGLQRAAELARLSAGEELVASEIRLSLDAIGRITGVVYTDDILDVVFKQFCIGK